jgi:DNA mismatch repair protein MSH4
MVQVLEPTEILFPKTALDPKSTLLQLFESNLTSGALSIIDRKYWSEEAGVTYIQQLAFKEDIEAIKGSIGANFYSVCCLSAVG